MENLPDYQRVEKALAFLLREEQAQPSLFEVAEEVALSPAHFQRIFQDWAGVSPKTFLQYLTVGRARKLLAEGRKTLETAWEVGLSGTGRLHDAFIRIEALRPGQFQSGGAGLDLLYSFHPSPFGTLIVVETDYGVHRVDFVPDRKLALETLREAWPQANFREAAGVQAGAVAAFFDPARSREEPIRLSLRGTPFQVQVWEALLRIPFGQLVSYGDLAAAMGQPKASRAVGSAIGQNPVAYLIPCHRVIRASGRIEGYKWGSLRKSALIGWEGVKG